jgi:hypothetical protein
MMMMVVVVVMILKMLVYLVFILYQNLNSNVCIEEWKLSC